jgi:hypothetical protein
MTLAPDHLDLARAVLDNPSAYPDPEAELERLRASAPADERFMYEMLFEGLAHAMLLAVADDRNPA